MHRSVVKVAYSPIEGASLTEIYFIKMWTFCNIFGIANCPPSSHMGIFSFLRYVKIGVWLQNDVKTLQFHDKKKSYAKMWIAELFEYFRCILQLFGCERRGHLNLSCFTLDSILSELWKKEVWAKKDLILANKEMQIHDTSGIQTRKSRSGCQPLNNTETNIMAVSGSFRQLNVD